MPQQQYQFKKQLLLLQQQQQKKKNSSSNNDSNIYLQNPGAMTVHEWSYSCAELLELALAPSAWCVWALVRVRACLLACLLACVRACVRAGGRAGFRGRVRHDLLPLTH